MDKMTAGRALCMCLGMVLGMAAGLAAGVLLDRARKDKDA